MTASKDSASSGFPAPGSLASDPSFRSGFVAVVGRPNVGKSTLVNRLVGAKVAITATVPQTTRTRLAGILTLQYAQIIFVDTPALQQPKHRLGQHMVKQAQDVVADTDVIVFVLDAAAGITTGDRRAAKGLRVSAPVIVALNKTDRLGPEEAEPLRAAAEALGALADVILVSAKTGTNTDLLVRSIVARLPEGPQLFPPEMVTDQPEPLLARELIREQAIRLTREELPHSVAVEIEEFAPRPDRDLIYIRATLHVEREAHKKMLIGRGGRLLKEIGRRARGEIEAMLGRHVYLDLWVKTSRNWRDREDLIDTFYPR